MFLWPCSLAVPVLVGWVYAFLWFYVQELPKAQPAVVLVFLKPPPRAPALIVSSKGEFQICPRMDLDHILYVEYLGYNNYKNEIILFLERC